MILIEIFCLNYVYFVEDKNTFILSEEYKIWKRNVPFMYDFMFTRATEYLSPTVQWLPEVEELSPDVVLPVGNTIFDGASVHRLLLGTNALQEENFIYIASIFLPGKRDDSNVSKRNIYHIDEDELGGFSIFNGKAL